MPIYDSSSQRASTPRAPQHAPLSEAPPHQQIFNAPPQESEKVAGENYQNMSDFADIMPADASPSVEDTERQILERLKEEDPATYEALLSQGQSAEPMPEPAKVKKKAPPREGFLSRIAKNLRLKSENDAQEWMEVLERPVQRPVVLGFTSFKGGCGKTSLSVITAAILRQCRPDDRVVIVDMDPSGNLVNRARGAQYADVQGYVAAIERQDYDPGPFVMDAGGGIDVIGSRIDPLSKDLVAREVIELVEVLTHYYDIVILDMPQRMDTNAYKALLLMLDVVTFVFEAKNDALASVESVIPVLRQNQADYLVDRRVVAFNNTSIVSSKTEKFDPQETVQRLVYDEGVEVVELPFADSLRNGGVLDRKTVPSREYNKFVQLAAAIINTIEDVRSVAKPAVLHEA